MSDLSLSAISLYELQGNFNQALHYQATGEACNIASDHFSADERMQVYRNNFIVSLSEVLEATYPMVLALVGEECFTQLARQHVLTQPLKAGDVTHYGEHFADTIEQFPAVMEAAPYCSEVARFEWAIDKSQQQRDGNTNHDFIPLVKLADIAPEQHAQVTFQFHAGVSVFESPYALFSLKQAIENNNFDALEINQAEQGVIACLDNGEQWTLALKPEPYQLLVAIQSGEPLGNIEPELLAHLNTLIELQLIAGFTL